MDGVAADSDFRLHRVGIRGVAGVTGGEVHPAAVVGEQVLLQQVVIRGVVCRQQSRRQQSRCNKCSFFHWNVFYWLFNVFLFSCLLVSACCPPVPFPFFLRPRIQKYFLPTAKIIYFLTKAFANRTIRLSNRTNLPFFVTDSHFSIYKKIPATRVTGMRA